MNTEEGNKLIADFMGARADTYGKWFIDHKFLGYEAKDFQYHTSWDWLMPVVEKIESIYNEHHGYFGVHISSNSCSIQGTNLHKAIEDLSGYGWVYMSDSNAILNTKIESTWYNVVEFINWHNQNKNQ